MFKYFIATLLASGLVASGASAQSQTNNPTPPDPGSPPVTCSTGKAARSDCYPESGRGYLLACPSSAPNLTMNVSKFFCQAPQEPAVPYLECQSFGTMTSCQGYPSDADELLFSWIASTPAYVTVSQHGPGGRYADIGCELPWAGTVTVYIYNSISGQGSYASHEVTCGGANQN
ncbi:hypothetical protein C7S18_04600 [Ahniella affigens]|uniref:Ig-like domain-containing protein n=1 Tax=Ahniella affigens TaxID=2021234 RepID=A0A2P1PNU5_9GAMM|nr:hypothetical protein [Ahniella affigens]AVP96521.1 hypothetical protein C7S18_04600 [Ahniella affigens]